MDWPEIVVTKGYIWRCPVCQVVYSDVEQAIVEARVRTHKIAHNKSLRLRE